MSKIFLLFVALFATTILFAQNENPSQNAAGKMIDSDKKLSIGGYGQMEYIQPLAKDIRKNGVLDVHRMVMLFGYKFNDRTNFVTEIEFEHVNELTVEQAFLNYKINKWLNFRGGLMLIPMGITNEYHEPTTFNGVNRPMVDTKIIPTTWRELGAGFTGSFNEISLKYQAYVVNGFNGYTGAAAMVNGNDAFRKARQKGIKSFISSPNFTTKVDYYGIRSLNIGGSLYIGNTQSTLLNGISRSDEALIAMADSSVLKMTMTAVDAKYNHHGLQLKGQLVYAAINNTEAYNSFAKNANTNKGIGRAMIGYYIEAGYNVFQQTKITGELIPFIRFEKYNTQHKTDGLTIKNELYDNTLIVTGLGWKITQGAIIKTDVEFSKNASSAKYAKTLNLGIGVWF